MKLGITASREGISPKQVSALLEWLVDHTYSIEEAHHGDCVGGDAIFHAFCRMLHIHTVAHPPDKNIHRAFCKVNYIHIPRPYLPRNRNMVDMIDYLLVVPRGPEIPRSGTWSTKKYAEKQGVQFEIIW